MRRDGRSVGEDHDDSDDGSGTVTVSIKIVY